MQKVVSTKRTCRDLDDVLSGITEEQDPIEAVTRLGTQLILQQVLEDEVSDFVGRVRHERAHGGEEVIYRNGFAEPPWSLLKALECQTVSQLAGLREAATPTDAPSAPSCSEKSCGRYATSETEC